MSRLLSFALLALMIAAFTGTAIADDVLWARLVELTKIKGLPVNFKRAGETLALPYSLNEYPSYEVRYDESDGTAHHFTVYEDVTKAAHLIITIYDKESEPYRLGHAYLLSPKGELISALEGLAAEKRLAGGMGDQWMWAQTSISDAAATAGFEKEVSYWKTKIHRLEAEPDREEGSGWEQKCEKGTCRWWNGREKKWAE
jgi:hypothetical protein